MFLVLYSILTTSHLKEKERIVFKNLSFRSRLPLTIKNFESLSIIYIRKKENTFYERKVMDGAKAQLSFNTLSSFPFVFNKNKLQLTSTESNMNVVYWQIPESFCSSIFNIKSIGELTSTITNSPHHFPLCIFSDPFYTKFKLSTYLTKNTKIKTNFSIDFYVGNAKDPFSSCDPGTECLFWHTQPFFMRIEGNPDPKFSYNIRYQAEAKLTIGTNTDLCFLGPINKFPGDINDQASSFTEEFSFQCNDEKSNNFEQMLIIFVIIVCIVIGIILFHFAGFLNIKEIVGCEDEQIRFKKAKEIVESVKSPDNCADINLTGFEAARLI